MPVARWASLHALHREIRDRPAIPHCVDPPPPPPSFLPPLLKTAALPPALEHKPQPRLPAAGASRCETRPPVSRTRVPPWRIERPVRRQERGSIGRFRRRRSWPTL